MEHFSVVDIEQDPMDPHLLESHASMERQLSMGTSCKSLRTQGPNQDPLNFGRAECPNQAET